MFRIFWESNPVPSEVEILKTVSTDEGANESNGKVKSTISRGAATPRRVLWQFEFGEDGIGFSQST